MISERNSYQYLCVAFLFHEIELRYMYAEFAPDYSLWFLLYKMKCLFKVRGKVCELGFLIPKRSWASQSRNCQEWSQNILVCIFLLFIILLYVKTVELCCLVYVSRSHLMWTDLNLFFEHWSLLSHTLKNLAQWDVWTLNGTLLECLTTSGVGWTLHKFSKT